MLLVILHQSCGFLPVNCLERKTDQLFSLDTGRLIQDNEAKLGLMCFFWGEGRAHFTTRIVLWSQKTKARSPNQSSIESVSVDFQYWPHIRITWGN